MLILLCVGLAGVGTALAGGGEVKWHQKISSNEGNFDDTLDDGDGFGVSSVALRDVDGDGIDDLAVGAPSDDDGGASRGAVYVLFLNGDGTVKTHQKISDKQGNFTGTLDDQDIFGVSLASLGDLDGDGVDDLAVGAPEDDDGGENRGAVWVLFLNSDGTVKTHQKISDTEGNFAGTLNDGDWLGRSVASVGDLDGDGVDDIAVGAPDDDDGGEKRGAVWVLFLNSDGTVKAHQKISDTEGNFTGVLDDNDVFGFSVASLGDLDGDMVDDLAVGATYDDDGGTNHGAVWVLFLNSNGTVKSHQKISDTEGNFTGTLDDGDWFGRAVASAGDLDNDGVNDLAVAAEGDDDGDDGDYDRGAVWVLFLNSDGTVKTHQKISDTEGNFTGILNNQDFFGSSVTFWGDLDGDGVGDLAVGASEDTDGGIGRGAVWVLFLLNDGTVKDYRKISETQANFAGTLDNSDLFGSSVASLGDLDGDGVGDLAVGARQDDDGGDYRGAVWILFLNSNGMVKAHQKISDTEGNFTGILDDRDRFGVSVASMGDLDGDGEDDLAVGAYQDDDGGSSRGAVWVLFLNSDGTVKAHQKISDTEGNFTGTLDNADYFGCSLASMGDLDGDGVADLAVGASHDDDGGSARGAVWVLFLNSDGTVKTHRKISDTEGSFTGILDDRDNFGYSVTALEDLDGDGVEDLAVGARWDDDGGADASANHGAVWVLFLNSDGTVKAHQKISDTEGGFTGTLDDDDLFGASVALLGDIDGDDVADLAVGALTDDDGGSNRGAVWVLALNSDGTVKAHQKISSTEGSFTGPLANGDNFGGSVASPGDLDGDGVVDLAVGARLDNDGGTWHGAVWVLFLEGEKATISAHLDVLPGSCPNPLNTNPYTKERKNGKQPEGVLPVALLGGPDFDVHDVDASSLRLEGVVPQRYSYEDVSGPAVDAEDCACAEDGADGHMDLMLKFSRSELVEAIGESWGSVELVLKGSLDDGSLLEAKDCVWVEKDRGKDDGPKRNESRGPAKLLAATPNPFNPVTKISFILPERVRAKLTIYDVAGRSVRTLLDEPLGQGNHERVWDGRDTNGNPVSSGVYFYRLKAGNKVLTKKMVLLK